MKKAEYPCVYVCIYIMCVFNTLRYAHKHEDNRLPEFKQLGSSKTTKYNYSQLTTHLLIHYLPVLYLLGQGSILVI